MEGSDVPGTLQPGMEQKGRAGLRVLGQDCSDRALHEEAEY